MLQPAFWSQAEYKIALFCFSHTARKMAEELFTSGIGKHLISKAIIGPASFIFCCVVQITRYIVMKTVKN